MNGNREIIDYRLIVKPSHLLGEKVVQVINFKTGWQPYGSPFYVGTEEDREIVQTNLLVAQAMVRYR